MYAVLIVDTVSKRLRRWTRNPLGSARRGSNPLAVVSVPPELDLASYTCHKPKRAADGSRIAGKVLMKFPGCTRNSLARVAAHQLHGQPL